MSSFELENFFKFVQAKQLDATTMFTYSHANTALGQSERAYYLSYFIKYSFLYYGKWIFYHLPYIRPQGVNIIFMNSYCIPFVRQHKRYIRVKTWVFNTTRVFITSVTFESFFNLTPVFTSGDKNTAKSFLLLWQ